MKVRLKELKSGFVLEKKIQRFTRKEKNLAIIALTLVIAFLVVFLGNSFGILPVDAISARVSTGLFGSGKNYPFKVTSDDVINIDIIGDSLLILTDKTVTVYNDDGNIVFLEKHTFSRPAISCNGKNGVVFDRNGTGYILINETGKISSGNTAGTIITAEFGKSGNYAFALRGDKSTSVLAVFEKQGEVRFQWNCAYEHISAITLSDDGKFCGVATMGAENGAIYTTVHYFGFEYNSALNTQKIKDVPAIDIKFTSNNMLTLFSSRGIYQIKKNGDEYKEISSYFSSEFNSISESKKNYAVCLAKYGSANVYEIKVFKNSGKEKSVISLDYKVQSMSMSDKYIFALAENCILVYNLSGREVGKISITGKLYGLYPTDKYCYIHSLGSISRCYSFGKTELELGFTI